VIRVVAREVLDGGHLHLVADECRGRRACRRR
jgi:hypothetical protein